MKVRVPLSDHTVGGIACPIPLISLRVQDRYGLLATMPFRVDTGADFTSIPIPWARRNGIPFSERLERRAIGLVGTTRMFRGSIRVVIAGRTHEWPCNFINIPAEAAGHGELPPVLGRTGFLDEYAVSIDAGFLIIARLGRVRRLLRRTLHRHWAMTGQVHPLEQPL
jgi:hypothetical protein